MLFTALSPAVSSVGEAFSCFFFPVVQANKPYVRHLQLLSIRNGMTLSAIRLLEKGVYPVL